MHSIMVSRHTCLLCSFVSIPDSDLLGQRYGKIWRKVDKIGIKFVYLWREGGETAGNILKEFGSDIIVI